MDATRGTHGDLHSEQGGRPGEHRGRSANPLVKVRDLAWLEFRKPDLARAEAFAHDFGFSTTHRTSEVLHLRGADQGAPCVIIWRGDRSTSAPARRGRGDRADRAAGIGPEQRHPLVPHGAGPARPGFSSDPAGRGEGTMRISVDYERCEGHGMCAISASDVFSLDDDGMVQYAYEGQDVLDSVATEVQFAASTCPVAALRQL